MALDLKPEKNLIVVIIFLVCDVTDDQSIFAQYTTSLYWASATGASVGYGDIHATSDNVEEVGQGSRVKVQKVNKKYSTYFSTKLREIV